MTLPYLCERMALEYVSYASSYNRGEIIVLNYDRLY